MLRISGLHPQGNAPPPPPPPPLRPTETRWRTIGHSPSTTDTTWHSHHHAPRQLTLTTAGFHPNSTNSRVILPPWSFHKRLSRTCFFVWFSNYSKIEVCHCPLKFNSFCARPLWRVWRGNHVPSSPMQWVATFVTCQIRWEHIRVRTMGGGRLDLVTNKQANQIEIEKLNLMNVICNED